MIRPSATPAALLALLALLGFLLSSLTISTAEESASRLFLKARTLYRHGEYREALEIAYAVEAAAPDRVLYGSENRHNFKGSCFAALRYFQHARKEFEKALAAQPESWDLKFNLAEMDFLQENFAAAREKFTELKETDRGRAISHFLNFKIGMCRVMEGHEGEVLKELEIEGTETPIYLFLSSAVALRKNKPDKATALLTLAREKLEADSYSLYEDSLVECGLLQPPQLPSPQQKDFDASLRRPLSLGIDRLNPDPVGLPESGADTESSPAATGNEDPATENL